MTDSAILAALRASVGNPEAIELLALIEFGMAQSFEGNPPAGLDDLIQEWANALIAIRADEVQRLKRQLAGRAKLASQNAAGDHLET